ncbi:hypothetical protein BC936DRAFT_146193 [Jimgerdemannia flammicorona]|uniref:P-type ATPase N-terminal domain-containing protein n=1 Tax=Jimgerdemannia flammicorona TaxID=994334 RepID=A0A433D848_9FUNG|nr:hypothetical protein BC936DRAFT_146193 [Jimgerdemannia flammicorona]
MYGNSLSSSILTPHCLSSQVSLYDDTPANNDDDDNLQLLTHQASMAGRPTSQPPNGGGPGDDPARRSRSSHRISLVSRISSLGGRRSTAGGAGGDGELGARLIHLNNPDLNDQQKFLHNRVFTAKYKQIPGISPTSKYTTLVPLLIVLTITAAKEIVEDWGVHHSDAELNARKCKVLEGQQFIEKKWRDIKVGDICRIQGGEFFPADLVLLSSSEPEGLCYIETSNLDGWIDGREKYKFSDLMEIAQLHVTPSLSHYLLHWYPLNSEVNLKIKQALSQTARLLNPLDVSRLQGTIKSEQPNNRLYNYEGTLAMMVVDLGKNKEFALDPTQLLLRGAQLRNTSWVYGAVVFTGHETKLMLNSRYADPYVESE